MENPQTTNLHRPRNRKQSQVNIDIRNAVIGTVSKYGLPQLQIAERDGRNYNNSPPSAKKKITQQYKIENNTKEN